MPTGQISKGFREVLQFPCVEAAGVRRVRHWGFARGRRAHGSDASPVYTASASARPTLPALTAPGARKLRGTSQELLGLWRRWNLGPLLAQRSSYALRAALDPKLSQLCQSGLASVCQVIIEVELA